MTLILRYSVPPRLLAGRCLTLYQVAKHSINTFVSIGCICLNELQFILRAFSVFGSLAQTQTSWGKVTPFENIRGFLKNFMIQYLHHVFVKNIIHCLVRNCKAFF